MTNFGVCVITPYKYDVFNICRVPSLLFFFFYKCPNFILTLLNVISCCVF